MATTLPYRRTQGERANLLAVPRRWELRPLSKEVLQERLRSLRMLSQSHVQDAYRKAWERAKLDGDVPNVQAVQELVQAFKVLWKWREKR